MMVGYIVGAVLLIEIPYPTREGIISARGRQSGADGPAGECLVQGKQYELSGCDTAFIPKGIPHRFLNKSKEPMAMVWVCAGDEPDRQILEADYCSEELAWPH
jgi:hypothetical protein